MAAAYLFALCLMCLLARGHGACETFKGEPAFCRGIVDYMVYVPDGLTQSSLSASLDRLTNALGYISETNGCRAASAQLGCSGAFRDCNTGAPTLVCPAVCEDFNTSCASFIKDGLIQAENIFKDDPLTGGKFYAAPGENCTIADGNATSSSGPELTCTGPSVYSPESNECVVKCPPPGQDDPRYQRIYQISVLVLSSISIISLALFILTGFATWDRRRGTAYYHCVALFIQLVGLWIGKWMPFDEWMCIEPWKVRDQSNTAGAIQAAFTIYGTLSAAFWILVLVYELVLRVTENRWQIFGEDKFIPIRPDYVYAFLGWFLIPVPYTIAMFAGDWADCTAGWVMLPSARALNGWLFPILYLVPVTVMAACQFFLMCFLFYFIGSRAGFRGIQSQVRLLALCIHYAIRVTAGLAFGWEQLGRKNQITHTITTYVQCYVDPTPDCPNPLKSPAFIGGWAGVLNAVLTSSAGFAILIIFTDMHVLHLWKRWITCKGFSTNQTSGNSTSASLAEDNSAGSRY